MSFILDRGDWLVYRPDSCCIVYKHGFGIVIRSVMKIQYHLNALNVYIAIMGHCSLNNAGKRAPSNMVLNTSV